MGELISINGPVVKAFNLNNPKIRDLVLVGKNKLYGEIITIKEGISTIQVYESTNGLSVGDKVITTGKPLTVELGPGMIHNVFDGLQRQLNKRGEFLKHSYVGNALDRKKRWEFKQLVKKGDELKKGGIVGEVNEEGFKHYIMLPPNINGTIISISSGDYSLDEPIGKIKTKKGIKNIYLYHEWPVKYPRPILKTLIPDKPLLTGQRVIDTLFPLALGGTSALPGPFGAGKTILQQSFFKYSKADIKIFVGCGERGNEIADLLDSMKNINVNGLFFINTSNMPIIARESSIYTAETVGEYFRDMGYNVLLMADSLSRWAESLREVSSMMNELPAEEGFPSYLPSRLAGFFERAGSVKTINNKIGSLTIIGSVSPPGGDFSEPVTQYATSIASNAWFLDSNLAFKRHYPAISWDLSYSKYIKLVNKWWAKKNSSWESDILIIRKLLEEENELRSLEKAVGFVALSREQKLKLLTANMIHEGILKQNAFNPIEYFCKPEKQALIIKLIVMFYKTCSESTKDIDDISNKPIINKLVNIKRMKLSELKKDYNNIVKQIKVIKNGY